MKKILFALVIGGGVSACTPLEEALSNHPASIHTKIAVAAEKHNVPPKFADAVIRVESRYNSKAVGGKGRHWGLGQMTCSTARGEGFSGDCKKLLDADVNLEYTMKHLRRALDKANNNECHAATLYNRGLGNAPRSSAYCKKVLSHYKK